MPSFKQNMFHELEVPVIVLSTKYHKHLGALETIDPDSINTEFNMSSYQEISFDVYKELNGQTCVLWDALVDLKYIYVPDFQEYYEITVSLDEDYNTIKHIVGKSACEAELSQRLLRNFECNTESDILRGDYSPTVFYNSQNEAASLLHRILHDKCPDYTILHVDSSLMNVQRMFSCDGTSVYDFLVNDVAEEMGCLFQFDSIHRSISVYDLNDTCNGYGLNTNILISRENFADMITIEGDGDSIKNCFKIAGGDDLMTATVANCNPNGSEYIYRISNQMKADMPEALIEKLDAYDSLYAALKNDYADYTEQLYEAIDEELYLTSQMMPTVTLPETSALQELEKLKTELTSVSVQNITALSQASADLAVKGMAKVIVDSRYKPEILSSALSDLIEGTSRTWTGKFKITNQSDDEDTAENETDLSVLIVGDNYQQYLYQKIQKSLDQDDTLFLSVFEIENLDDFKTALKDYCLDSLKSFESSYQTCIEVLIENGVTDKNATFYDVDLYNLMYTPYYERIIAIQEELIVREAEIAAVQETNAYYSDLRTNIQQQLDFKDYLGDDLWLIFCSYLREDTYTNSNYISDGLSNTELIQRATELFETASNEIYKSSELQLTLSCTLENLLSIKEFQAFQDKLDIGNWITCKADSQLYKLRLIHIGIDYSNLSQLSVTFSNVEKIKNAITDTESILSQAQSIAGSFQYVSHQASQGKAANDTVEGYRKTGLDAAQYNITNSETQDIIYDGHGISCRQYDDVTESHSPEELRIINNTIAFTKDGWKTVNAALGKLRYQLDDTIHEDYGLNADHVVAGTVIGGNIYSSNYSSNNKVGTHINLDDGSFSFAGNKLAYTASENQLNLSGNFTVGGKNNLDGTISVKNAADDTAIEINNTGIVMADGTSLINASGICGDLTFASNGGTPDWLGYNVLVTNTTNADLITYVNIPNNFIVTSAIVSLITNATYWSFTDLDAETSETEYFWGYPRGIKLYYSTDGSGVFRIADWPGEYWTFSNDNWEQIVSGDFSNAGVDGSASSANKILYSADIKDYISTGNNIIKVGVDAPSHVEKTDLQHTGTGVLLVSVKGYTKN